MKKEFNLEPVTAGLLFGTLLRVISDGETSLVISLLIPTLYYNYKFFKKIIQDEQRKKI